jgi:hypothetical protein
MSFNPNNWCDDVENINLETHPVKKLICIAVDLLNVFTPVVRFTEIMIKIIKDFLVDNHVITELLLILAPIAPITLLVGYFFDTL